MPQVAMTLTPTDMMRWWSNRAPFGLPVAPVV